MIVADANLLAYLFIKGEHTAEAERALLRDPEWAAPRLWRSEFRSVLALYLRREILTTDDARALMNSAQRLMSGREFEPDSDTVLHVLQRSSISAYDAEYVALAEDLALNLVTSDRKLFEAFPSIVVSLRQFATEER